MVIINGPFLVALIVIIYVIVTKWLEWYLFKNGTFRSKQKNSETEIRTARVRKDAPETGTGFDKVKGLLFFEKADLVRPWYGRIPLYIFIISNSLLNTLLKLQPWQMYLYFLCAIVIIIWVEVLTVIRANKGFFSEKERKRKYIRTQIAQFGLAVLIGAVIFAGLQLSYNHRHLDPPGLKESVSWVIEPVYEASWPEFTEGLVPVGRKGQKGFIDKNGGIVIPFRYDDAGNFHEGLAAVKQDGRWGYIDREANAVIPFQYEEASEFGDGLAPVKKDGKWMVIDHTGSVLFETDYKYIGTFCSGVAIVERQDNQYNRLTHFNLIDTEGSLLFQKDYGYFNNFSDGCIFAWDEETGKGFFLDKNEKKVIPQSFIEASQFSNGIAAVWLEDGKYALIDRSGNLIREIEEREYNNYLLCDEGLITANNGESIGGNNLRYGFQDLYGNIVIPVEFQDVNNAGDGMIGLTVNGLWGFVENPLPEAARVVDPEIWTSDRTQIATVEGLPVYAGELESHVFGIKEENPELIGIPAYKKAFDQIKTEKAVERYGKNIDPEKIRYQIGDTYYKKLLL